MKDRIRQLMEAQHMNQQAFALCTGLGTASLSSIFTGRTRPTLNHVDAILEKFPNVNPMWLLKGQGGMFLTADEAAAVNASGSSPNREASVSTSSDGEASTESANMAVMPNLFTVPTNTQRSASPTPSNGRAGAPGFRFEDSSKGSHSASASGIMQPQQQPPIPPRKITEIRVFYDDQTWESFTPKK